MTGPMHWVGISGSLRKDSYNTRLLHAARELLPDGVTMEIVSIANIPLYNGDLDIPTVTKRPAEVQQFRDILAKADGLVIVSPEYNHSIPGGLKNALDWASRGEDSPLLNKPVALLGATTGMGGTARMQLAFLPLFQYLNMQPANKPEVLIAKAQDKFYADGRLSDEKAKEIIQKKLANLKLLTAKSKEMLTPPIQA